MHGFDEKKERERTILEQDKKSWNEKKMKRRYSSFIKIKRVKGAQAEGK